MEKGTADSTFYYTPLDLVRQEFASRGLIVLSPEDVGVSSEIHSCIFTKEKELVDNGETNHLPDHIQAIL